MNRQRRRQQERLAKRFEQKKTWTKAEHTVDVEYAYELGLRHALQAATTVLGLGKTRLGRIRDEVLRIEKEKNIVREG